MDDKSKQNAQALTWLFEMEMINDPQLKFNLYQNVYICDKRIRDCKIFITPSFTYQKGILIWIKVSWLCRLFKYKKKEIEYNINSVMNGLLPSFKIRIIYDEKILALAQSKLEERYGGKNEKINTTDDALNALTYDTDKLKIKEPGLQQEPNILSDSKEQTEDQQKIRDEVEQSDSQDDKETQDPS